MEKIDYKKELKHLYNPSAKKVEIVNVPKMNYLMVDGKGDPNTAQQYKDAVEVLFGLSYAIKFLVKKGDIGIDYGVMPMEGLWWVDDMSMFDIKNKDDWNWTSMMMQPELVTKEILVQATDKVKQKKHPVALAKVRFESITEGKVAQILHIGPFSEEGPTIDRIHKHIEDNGYQLCGKHHEIYLSDIRRAAPEKWRTVIRQPFK